MTVDSNNIGEAIRLDSPSDCACRKVGWLDWNVQSEKAIGGCCGRDAPVGVKSEISTLEWSCRGAESEDKADNIVVRGGSGKAWNTAPTSGSSSKVGSDMTDVDVIRGRRASGPVAVNLSDPSGTERFRGIQCSGIRVVSGDEEDSSGGDIVPRYELTIGNEEVWADHNTSSKVFDDTFFSHGLEKSDGGHGIRRGYGQRAIDHQLMSVRQSIVRPQLRGGITF